MLQVICALGLVPTTSPHETTFVRRHGTATVTARCPEGTQLFAGGFQRTNFTTPGVVGYGGIKFGGNYITESRAVGTTAWRVSAGAVDQDGGELTAIAHVRMTESPSQGRLRLDRDRRGQAGVSGHPRCPRGLALVAEALEFGGSHDALFAQGYFTRKGTWATTGYGWFA